MLEAHLIWRELQVRMDDTGFRRSCLESITTMFEAIDRIAEGGMKGRLRDGYVDVDIEHSFGQNENTCRTQSVFV